MDGSRHARSLLLPWIGWVSKVTLGSQARTSGRATASGVKSATVTAPVEYRDSRAIGQAEAGLHGVLRPRVHEDLRIARGNARRHQYGARMAGAHVLAIVEVEGMGRRAVSQDRPGGRRTPVRADQGAAPVAPLRHGPPDILCNRVAGAGQHAAEGIEDRGARPRDRYLAMIPAVASNPMRKGLKSVHGRRD